MYTYLELKTFIKTLNILYIGSVKSSSKILEKLNNYFSHIDQLNNEQKNIEKFIADYQQDDSAYDIIIIDTEDINYIELTETILSKNTEQLIIILSQENHEILALREKGIYNFIKKPIDDTYLETVILQVSSMLQQHRIIQNQQLDIEEIKHNLEAARQKSEKASHQKSYFLANMSHEIRTPLNAIMGFITLLHEKETDKEKLKYLDILQTSSETLLQVINDILDITKIESGKLTIDKLSFDPYEKLMHTTELFQVTAAKKDVIFKIFVSQSLPKLLIGDPFRVKQILSNLLSNAIKFTPSGSKVKCVIWYAKGSLNIMVKDYGIGIVKEKQDYIFEAFHQADNIMATEYGGTGLGLALCTELTKMLDGSLTFKENKAGGSIFTLSIKMPISDEKPTLATTDNKDISKATLQGHILIVDDIEANRMFISILLDNANLTYDMAENGFEAIEKFTQNKYDLILMDENMPRLRGSQAAMEIKKLEKELHREPIPIISLTANALEGDKERFLDAGMDGYISKPVQPNALFEIIEKFL